MGRRDRMGGYVRQLLIVHQQDVFDIGATTGRNFERPGFLSGDCALDYGSFGDTERIKVLTADRRFMDEVRDVDRLEYLGCSISGSATGLQRSKCKMMFQ